MQKQPQPATPATTKKKVFLMQKLMKATLTTLFIVAIFTAFSQPKQPARTWYLSQLGVLPNQPVCYSNRIQQLIDSAYNLPGITKFVLRCGTYNMSTFTDLTKKRKDSWWFIQFVGDGYSLMKICGVTPPDYTPQNTRSTTIDLEMLFDAYDKGVEAGQKLAAAKSKPMADSINTAIKLQMLKQAEATAIRNWNFLFYKNN